VGPTGVAGTKIYSGIGPPSNSIGTTGDFYYDITSGIFYGPKPAPSAIPVAPQNLIIDAVTIGTTTTVVALRWDILDVVSYKLYYDTAPITVSSPFSSVTTNYDLSLNIVTGTTLYYFAVAGVNREQVSGPLSSSITLVPSNISVPTGVTATYVPIPSLRFDSDSVPMQWKPDGTASCQITWNPPINSYGQLTYKITYTDGVGLRELYSGTARTFTFYDSAPRLIGDLYAFPARPTVATPVTFTLFAISYGHIKSENVVLSFNATDGEEEQVLLT
jgi:hypothetical protein